MSKAFRLSTLVVFIAALAVVATAADTYSFKRIAKVGDTIKFKLVVDADFGGTKINVTGITHEKVVKVADNGDITTESTQTDTKIKMADQEMPMPEQEPETSTTSAKGLVLEIKGDNVDANTYRLANMNTVVTPDNPVKVGDKWAYEFKANEKTGAVAAKSSYEVLAVEKLLGYDTVKLKWSFKESEGSEPASAEGTLWINVKDFSIVKASGEFKKAPLPGAPGPIDMTVTLERQ